MDSEIHALRKKKKISQFSLLSKSAVTIFSQWLTHIQSVAVPIWTKKPRRASILASVYLTIVSIGSSSPPLQWQLKISIRLHNKRWVICFLARLSLSCKISGRFRYYGWPLSKKLFQTPRYYKLSNDLVLSHPVRSDQRNNSPRTSLLL